jgi:catechol 2,3-dioxygenase-like lactoylglutathione lyase family enzyme
MGEETNIGQLRLILKVEDLEKSLNFYTSLGFERIDTEAASEHFVSLWYRGFVLDLMQDIIPQKMMLHFLSQTWTEVDVAVKVLERRGLSLAPAGPDNKGAYIEDPDANAIYLSQP